MYRRRKALLLEWPISATKPEFKKSPFEVDASATSIESIFPVKQKNKNQAALCACTQLHATRKISYNCRSIIERGTKCKKTITLHKQHKHMTAVCVPQIVFNCVQICSDHFEWFPASSVAEGGRSPSNSSIPSSSWPQQADEICQTCRVFCRPRHKKWQKLQSIESESHSSSRLGMRIHLLFQVRASAIWHPLILRDPMALQLQASWNPEVAKKIRGHRILFHIHRNQFPQLLCRQIARPISRAICSVRAAVVPGIQAPNSNKMNKHEEWIMMSNASTWVNIKAKRKYQHKNPMYDTSHETDSLLIQSRWHPKKPSRLLGNMSRKMGISAWIGWRSWFVSRYKCFDSQAKLHRRKRRSKCTPDRENSEEQLNKSSSSLNAVLKKPSNAALGKIDNTEEHGREKVENSSTNMSKKQPRGRQRKVFKLFAGGSWGSCLLHACEKQRWPWHLHNAGQASGKHLEWTSRIRTWARNAWLKPLRSTCKEISSQVRESRKVAKSRLRHRQSALHVDFLPNDLISMTRQVSIEGINISETVKESHFALDGHDDMSLRISSISWLSKTSEPHEMNSKVKAIAPAQLLATSPNTNRPNSHDKEALASSKQKCWKCLHHVDTVDTCEGIDSVDMRWYALLWERGTTTWLVRCDILTSCLVEAFIWRRDHGDNRGQSLSWLSWQSWWMIWSNAAKNIILPAGLFHDSMTSWECSVLEYP